MPVNECKDCTRRHLGCHSTCESYIAYRKAKDESNYWDWIKRKEGQEVKRCLHRKTILSTHMK